MPNESLKLIQQEFNFLKTHFGFNDLKNDLGYTKNDLELVFHIGNGQVDISFFVRKDNEIFKPYISRSFELLSVLNRIKKSDLEAYPSEITGYLTSTKLISLHLAYYARLLKEHGTEILNGDISILEHIHTMRTISAKKTLN